MRVLIFCSDNETRVFLQRQLQMEGWIVAFATSTGPAGVRLLRSQAPNLVIVDDSVGPGFVMEQLLDAFGQEMQIPVILLLSPFNSGAEALLSSECVVAACAKPVREVDLYLALLQAEANFAKINALRLKVEQLQEKLETRKVVDRAKGFLMKALGISEEEAYRQIQRESMKRRTSMRAVAEAIIKSSGSFRKS
ncbi:ANTAR domain-containing response regulator [Desulfothermobacter acidiphilus]|uniref:ANTAR domain-containing response regulator n=1 Tax=Desulfothermobacter acidiphilus TaxID=1938353 RepID=UPI003F8A41CF